MLPEQGTLGRDKYRFFGWSDGTTRYSPGSVYYAPDEDVELQAAWDPVITENPAIHVAAQYETSTLVAIDVPAGAEVYYTLDGSDPNAEAERYWGQFELSRPGKTVIRAVAIREGAFPSAVVVASSTSALREETINGVTWQFVDGRIIGATGVGKSTLVVPAKLGGMEVTTIGARALRWLDSTAVIISEGIKRIGYMAFYDSLQLREVVLPSTLQGIEDEAFDECARLAVVYWCMKTPPSIGEDVLSNTSESLVSKIPWDISTDKWCDRAYEKWTPPSNGASGMVGKVGSTYYKITFVPHGENAPKEVVEVEANAMIGTLPVPTRPGYSFVGWFTEASGGTQITASVKAVKDISYYAHWTVVKYKLTYELVGGVNASGNPATYTIEDEIRLANPTRSGYTFKCWRGTEPGDAGVIARGSTGDRTLYAVWELSTGFSITFDANGGSGMMVEQPFPRGKVFRLPKCTLKPPKDKTAFAGWAGSNNVRYDDEMLVYNLGEAGTTVKFTAIWQ